MDHDARSSHHGEGVPAGAAGSAAGSAGAGVGGPGGPEGMRGLPVHGGPPGMGNYYIFIESFFRCSFSFSFVSIDHHKSELDHWGPKRI